MSQNHQASQQVSSTYEAPKEYSPFYPSQPHGFSAHSSAPNGATNNQSSSESRPSLSLSSAAFKPTVSTSSQSFQPSQPSQGYQNPNFFMPPQPHMYPATPNAQSQGLGKGQGTQFSLESKTFQPNNKVPAQQPAPQPAPQQYMNQMGMQPYMNPQQYNQYQQMQYMQGMPTYPYQYYQQQYPQQPYSRPYYPNHPNQFNQQYNQNGMAPPHQNAFQQPQTKPQPVSFPNNPQQAPQQEPKEWEQFQSEGNDKIDREKFSVPNTKTESKPVTSSFGSALNPNVTPFVPQSQSKAPVKEVAKEPPKEVKPKDALTLKLEKAGYDEEKIASFKEISSTFRSESTMNLGAFLKLKTHPIAQEKCPKGLWSACLRREGKDKVLEQQFFQKKPYGNPRGGMRPRGGRGGYNQGNDDFEKGTASAPKDEGWVRPSDSERREIIQQAKAVFDRISKDKTQLQNIQLAINQIAPDNCDKKFEELRKHIYGDLKFEKETGYDPEVHKKIEKIENIEIMTTIVELVFRKAQNEKEYCVFYGDFCERMIRLELSLKGIKTTMKNLKHSEFRDILIQYCKKSFDKFFQEDKSFLEDIEEQAKYTHRLFCNIKFVGELNRRQFISEPILISIFDLLMALDTKEQLKFVDVSLMQVTWQDYTVEGAKILMDKVGHTIDAKIAKHKQDKASEKEQMKKLEESGKSAADIAKQKEKLAKKIEKGQSAMKAFNNIFRRFDQLVSPECQEVSNRVKMLIKNMQDDRKDGWQKILKKIEEGPKKVEELRKQEIAKMQQKQQEQEENKYADRYNDGPYNAKGGGRTARANTTLNKQSSQVQYQKKDSTKAAAEVAPRSSVKYVKKQSSMNDGLVVPIEENEMQKQMRIHFSRFCGEVPEEEGEEEQKNSSDAKEFRIYSNFVVNNGRTTNEIILLFFKTIFDEPFHLLEKYFHEYFVGMVEFCRISKEQVAEGISMHLRNYSELLMDLPNLKELLVNLLSALITADLISLPNLKFYKAEYKEDDDFCVDEIFCLMAGVLKRLYLRTQSWQEVRAFYQKNGFQKQFRQVKELILQENLFEDESSWPVELNPHLRYLLDQDADDSLKNQENFNKLL